MGGMGGNAPLRFRAGADRETGALSFMYYTGRGVVAEEQEEGNWIGEIEQESSRQFPTRNLRFLSEIRHASKIENAKNSQ